MLIEIKPKDLIWDKNNREHITKHDLTHKHIEQVFIEARYLTYPAKDGKISIIGSSGKRRITVILRPKMKGFYVVTARDASKEERQFYREKINL